MVQFLHVVIVGMNIVYAYSVPRIVGMIVVHACSMPPPQYTVDFIFGDVVLPYPICVKITWVDIIGVIVYTYIHCTLGGSMGRPKKTPITETLDTAELDLELVTALQQYTDDDAFIADMLNLAQDSLPPRKHSANPTQYVDFALWHTAAIKKDIRAIQYWLDAHAKATYGKSVAVDSDESLKAEILEALAKRLPD